MADVDQITQVASSLGQAFVLKSHTEERQRILGEQTELLKGLKAQVYTASAQSQAKEVT